MINRDPLILGFHIISIKVISKLLRKRDPSVIQTAIINCLAGMKDPFLQKSRDDLTKDGLVASEPSAMDPYTWLPQ